jgi:NAD(P)-dependent dehydrogenase (short-subunit alcohol dehydrogenase family)
MVNPTVESLETGSTSSQPSTRRTEQYIKRNPWVRITPSPSWLTLSLRWSRRPRKLGLHSGECAVVTGAANGIGRATAVMLARSGVTVAAWDVEADPLQLVVSEIKAAGGKAHGVVADLQRREAIVAAWDETSAIGLPVPYLVNNAGPPAPTDLPVPDGVQLALGIYAEVTDGWLEAHSGEAASVTFTASVAGTLSAAASIPAWYPTAKAGIVGYMKHLAVKHRGRPRANSVAPGVIATRRTAGQLSSGAGQRRMRESPMGRAGQPEEVAAAICFLLSPAAAYVNGVLIPVDGAATLTSA